MSQVNIEQAMQVAFEHHQARRIQQAEITCRQILKVQPKHPEALHLLGVIAGQFGRHDLAAELIRQAIAVSPNSPDYYCNLGFSLKSQGQLQEAITCYQKALSITPEHPGAHLNLGNVWRDKSDIDHAIRCYRRAVELKPDYFEALNNLGNALKDKGEVDRAIAYFQRALGLNGDFSPAHYNLGVAWYEKGQVDQAIGCFRRALALDPKSVKAHNYLGLSFHAKGRIELAIDCYQRALLLDPAHVQAHLNLGNARLYKGEVDQAITSYQRALELNPSYVEAISNLGNAWKAKGQLDEAISCYRKALDLNPHLVRAHDNLIFILHMHPDSDSRSIFAECQRWNHQHAQPLKRFIQPHTNVRNPDRRLRVGYISPEFLNHPIGRFILPLFSAHNHKTFEIFCYCDVVVPDEMTAKLASLADRWRSTVNVSDEQAADVIRRDQIDILVDLTMHAANNRLSLFAQKPAPVQITYLAYAGGTAVDAIDYRLTDRYLDPDEAADRYYMEKSIRLAGTYWCYQQNVATPLVNELPALTTGTVTFGCLNEFAKVTQITISTWAQLLRSLPNARLLLHAPAGSRRDQLIDFMTGQGVATIQLEFADRVPLEEYFKIYSRIDIALDPFPYCGGTTTCDALWMGVPVVTLRGHTASGRGGVSLLSHIGLPELIAYTPQEYIRLATDLANDLPRLTEHRRTLRPRMQASPLMDGPRFARDVESAYRFAWRSWCEK